MNSSGADKAVAFFKNLDKDHMELVDEFYDQNVDFQDPVHKLKGAVAVRNYYAQLYKNVKSIRFEFSKTISQGNNAVLVWKMFLVTPDLNGGREFSVDGNSVFLFGEDGKALSHRDFFDMGEFIYERVPVLKSVIGIIKGKLGN